MSYHPHVEHEGGASHVFTTSSGMPHIDVTAHAPYAIGGPNAATAQLTAHHGDGFPMNGEGHGDAYHTGMFSGADEMGHGFGHGHYGLGLPMNGEGHGDAYHTGIFSGADGMGHGFGYGHHGLGLPMNGEGHGDAYHTECSPVRTGWVMD